MPADRHPLRPVRPPRLGDVDLAAGRIDLDPEASEIATRWFNTARDIASIRLSSGLTIFQS